MANNTSLGGDLDGIQASLAPVTSPVMVGLELAAIGISLGLIIVCTLVGNGLVVGAVVCFRRLRSITNYFVVSLAVADLTVALLVMPNALVYELRGQWTFGWIFCYFWISCDVTCCTASILHLCVISVDRYLAITEPLTYGVSMSPRRATVVIAGVWGCSAAISFVPIYLGWFADSATQSNLYLDSIDCGLHVNQVYAVVSSTTSFYLPLVVMAVLYSKIFRIARDQSREIRKLNKCLDHDHAPAAVDQRTRNAHARRRSSRDSKAIKTLGTLMGLFCFSWLPFFVVYVIQPFCSESCCFPASLISIITWLGYCNSFFNPCVYALINRDFRMAYKRLLLCQRDSHPFHRDTGVGVEMSHATAAVDAQLLYDSNTGDTLPAATDRLSYVVNRQMATVSRSEYHELEAFGNDY